MDELPRPVLHESPADRARAWMLSILDGAPRTDQARGAGTARGTDPDGSTEPIADLDLPLLDPADPEDLSATGRLALGDRPVLAVLTVASLTAIFVLVGAWGFQQITAWQQRSSVAAEDLLPIVEPVAPVPSRTVPQSAVEGDGMTETAEPDGEVLIHVAGQVRRPGVVAVSPASRVVDAVDAAGGATDAADLDRLNLAAPVADGERIHVPALGQLSPSVANPQHASVASADAGTGSGAAGPVDLNTATTDALETLNGVGPVTAAAILDHRDRNGPFFAVDDLLDVPGIGPAKLEAMRSQVVAG